MFSYKYVLSLFDASKTLLGLHSFWIIPKTGYQFNHPVVNHLPKLKWLVGDIPHFQTHPKITYCWLYMYIYISRLFSNGDSICIYIYNYIYISYIYIYHIYIYHIDPLISHV
jgi:hypothetical protein